MSSCSADNCSISCEGGCGCVSESQHPENCSCFCSGSTGGGGGLARMSGNGKLGPLQLDSVIELCTQDLPLKDLAQIFEQITPYRLRVPVAREAANVTVRISNVTVGKVLEDMGLSVNDVT